MMMAESRRATIFSEKTLNKVENLFKPNKKGKFTKSKIKRQDELINLSNRFYESIPDKCWKTEENLARELGVSRRQIENAKAYLYLNDRIYIQLQPNGKRSNPSHYIYKIEDLAKEPATNGLQRAINWELLASISINDFSLMSIEDILDIYEEMNLPFYPVHYPKFGKKGNVYCSCKNGKNCDSIGKHPAVTLSKYDFSEKSTLREMKMHWTDKDNRYNIGFRTDSFAVIDIDYRHFGHKSLGYIEEIYGELPKGLMAGTGDGYHFYVSNILPSSTNLLGYPGIDVRSKGGMITAPFSQHKSGKIYEWKSVSIPESLPDEWLNAVNEETSVPANSKQLRKRQYLPKNFNGYSINEGERSDTIFRVAARLRGEGKNYSEILENLTIINQESCVPPLPEYRLVNTAKSVYKRYVPNVEKELALKP